MINPWLFTTIALGCLSIALGGALLSMKRASDRVWDSYKILLGLETQLNTVIRKEVDMLSEDFEKRLQDHANLIKKRMSDQRLTSAEKNQIFKDLQDNEKAGA